MSNIYSIWGIKLIFWITKFGKVLFNFFSFLCQGGLVQVYQMLRRTTCTWPMPFYATPIKYIFMALWRFILPTFATFLWFYLIFIPLSVIRWIISFWGTKSTFPLVLIILTSTMLSTFIPSISFKWHSIHFREWYGASWARLAL